MTYEGVDRSAGKLRILSDSTEQTTPKTRPPIFRFSKRHLCYVLAALWLLDGALQFQPFMFTSGFAHQVLAPAAGSQPWFVAGPVNWNARLVAAHPVLLNSFFATVQVLLGVGFVFRRTVRIAIVGSVAWSAGVWYLGEGLGGLASGHTSALVGAPGAAILYGILALAAWPGPEDREPLDSDLPRWTLKAWLVLWIGFALLDVLPSNLSSTGTRGAFLSAISGSPGWIASIDRTLAAGVNRTGVTASLLMAGVELAVAVSLLGGRRLSSIGLYLGVAVSLFYWVVGQGLGQLFSGQATDPSTGPLLVVLALVVSNIEKDELCSDIQFRRLAMTGRTIRASTGDPRFENPKERLG